MLVTATLDHLNHAAAMSEMLSLGIKENKQSEAALAAVAALSSDCTSRCSDPPSTGWPSCGESVMEAEGSANELIPVDPDRFITCTGRLESSPFLGGSQKT